MAINPYDRIVPFNPIKSYIPQSPDFNFLEKALTNKQKKFDDTGLALDKVELAMSNLKDGLASRGFAEGAQSEYAPQLEALQKELSTTGNVSAVTKQLIGLQQKFQSDPRVKFMTADYAKKAEGIAMRDDLTKRHGLQRLVNPDGTFNGQSWDNFDPNVNVDDLYSVVSTPKQDMRTYAKDIVTSFVPEFNKWAENKGFTSRVEGDKVVFYDITEKGTEKKLSKEQVESIMLESGFIDALWEDSHETLNYYKEEKRFREGREATKEEFMGDILSLGAPFFFEHKDVEEGLKEASKSDFTDSKTPPADPRSEGQVPTGAADVMEYNTLEEINTEIANIAADRVMSPQEKGAVLTELYEQKYMFEELVREWDQQNEGAYDKELQLKQDLFATNVQGDREIEKNGKDLVALYRDKYLEATTIPAEERTKRQQDMANAIENLELSDTDFALLNEIINSERVQEELDVLTFIEGGSTKVEKTGLGYNDMSDITKTIKEFYQNVVLNGGWYYRASPEDKKKIDNMHNFLDRLKSDKEADQLNYNDLKKGRQSFIEKGFEQEEKGFYILADGTPAGNASHKAITENWKQVAMAGNFEITGDPWNRNRKSNEEDDALKNILKDHGEVYMLNFDGTLTMQVDFSSMTPEQKTKTISYYGQGGDLDKLKKAVGQGRTAFFRIDSPTLDDSGSSLGAAIRMRYKSEEVDAFRLNGKINAIKADSLGEDIGNISPNLAGFIYKGVGGTTMIEKPNGEPMSYTDLLIANQDSDSGRRSLQPYLRELFIRGTNGDMKAAEIAVNNYVLDGIIPQNSFLNSAVLGSDFNNPSNRRSEGTEVPLNKLTLGKNAMFDTAMKLGSFVELTNDTFTNGELSGQVSNPKLDRELTTLLKESVDRLNIPFTINSAYRDHTHPIEAAKQKPGAHSKAAVDISIKQTQEQTFLSLINTNAISLAEVKDQWLTFKNGTMRMMYHQNSGNNNYHIHIEKI